MMELEDCVLPAVKSVAVFTDIAEAIASSDLVVVTAGTVVVTEAKDRKLASFENLSNVCRKLSNFLIYRIYSTPSF